MNSQHIFPLLLFLLLFLGGNPTFSQLYEIKSGDKWGFINAQGELVVSPRYDYLYGDDLSDPRAGFWVFLQADKMGLYHQQKGELVPARYDRLQVHRSGPLAGYVQTELKGKIGLMDTLGQEILPPEYEGVDQPGPGIFAIRKGGKWGIWDAEGIFRIPAAYDGFRTSLDSFLIAWQEERFSAWSPKGEALVQEFPAAIEFLTPGLLTFEEALSDSLLTQAELAAAEEAEAAEITELSPFLLMPTDQPKLGLLSAAGTLVSPAEYEEIRLMGDYVEVSKENRKGLYDASGRCLLDCSYQRIQPDSTGHIWAQKNEKWGVLDQVGNWLMPLRLTKAGSFQGKIAMVQSRNGQGVLNHDGELVIDTLYQAVKLVGQVVLLQEGSEWRQVPLSAEGRLEERRKIILQGAEQEEELIIPNFNFFGPGEINPRDFGWFVGRSNRWGWRDSSEVVRIPPTFDEVKVFPEFGLSLGISSPGHPKYRRCALVDHRRGRMLIRTSQELSIIYMNDFRESQIARAQYSSGAFTLVNRQGQIAPLARVTFIGRFNNGYAPAYVAETYFPVPDQLYFTPRFSRPHRGKWGYLTQQGTWGIPAKYEEAYSFSQGIGRFRLQGKWGAVDSNLYEIIPPRYDDIPDLRMSNYCRPTRLATTDSIHVLAVKIKASKMSYLEAEKGNLIFSGCYQASGDFHEGLVAVQVGEKWGYLDRTGKMVIEPQFDVAGDFHEGLARVRRYMRWGFIDHAGTYQIAAEYQQAGDFVEGLAVVKYRGEYGYLKRAGGWHIRPRFTRAEDFFQGRAIAHRRHGKGVIDTIGAWVIPPRYAKIWRNPHGFKVKKDGVYGFLDWDGNELLAPKYRLISDGFSEGVGRVLWQDQWGYIDSNYHLIAPAIYDQALPFSQGLGRVKLQGKWGLLNAQGEEVLPCEYETLNLRAGGEIFLQKTPSDPLEVIQLAEKPAEQTFTSSPDRDARDGLRIKLGFSTIHPPRESIIVAETDYLYGLITYEGEVLLPALFESIQLINGMYRVRKDGDIGYLDAYGKWIYPIPLTR